MGDSEGYDHAALEEQYSPSSCVDDLDALLADYVSGSKASEARAPVRKDLRYGEQPDELLDLFSTGDSNSALQVFIHGGYWQQLSKNESTFAGADFVENGIAFAAPDYTLAPQAKIAQMIEQCRKSIAWLYRNSGDLGFNRDRIYVSGSSAGAHLACMVALTDWEAYGLPADVIKGATLMSGIYDLRPICLTYINEPLGLDDAEATALSPLYQDLSGRPPAIICWGEYETDEFKRQSRSFSLAWKAAGNKVTALEIAGYNHFDLVHALADRESALGQLVFEQMLG